MNKFAHTLCWALGGAMLVAVAACSQTTTAATTPAAKPATKPATKPKPQVTPTPRVPRPTRPPATSSDEFICTSIAQVSQDDASVYHFAALRKYFWDPGATLNITFLDGLPTWHAQVERIAKEWMKYANIKLQFRRSGKNNIRISFKQTGWWSLIGTVALKRARGATMNLHSSLFRKPFRNIRRTVLHEFGHALGLLHEHQNPKSRFTWNKALIYRELRKRLGWSSQKVDVNFFNRYFVRDVHATGFDTKSIMLYPLSRTWTKEGVHFPENFNLSRLDRREIAKIYPGTWRPGGRPIPRINTVTIARQVRFRVAGTRQGLFTNYTVRVAAPLSALRQIDHVRYQRQHRSHQEFKRGKYYGIKTRSNNFEFSWKAFAWHPVKVHVVYKNGKYSTHQINAGPRRVLRPTTNYARIGRRLKFRYTKRARMAVTHHYRIELDSPELARHIHYVEYQRQGRAFFEKRLATYIRRNLRARKFAYSWTGLPARGFVIRVHFRNGTTRTYRHFAQPITTSTFARRRYRSRNGYSYNLPLNWKPKQPGVEQFFDPTARKNNEVSFINVQKTLPLILTRESVLGFRRGYVAQIKKQHKSFRLTFYGTRLFGDKEVIYTVGGLRTNGKDLGIITAVIAGTPHSTVVTCIAGRARWAATATACERVFRSVRFDQPMAKVP